MSRKRADWIDARLRQTTSLGESSALVANDIAVNLPSELERPYVIVIETGGGSIQGVYGQSPSDVLVILIDHDGATWDPANGATPISVKPLDSLDNWCKAIMFDAGIVFRNRV